MLHRREDREKTRILSVQNTDLTGGYQEGDQSFDIFAVQDNYIRQQLSKTRAHKQSNLRPTTFMQRGPSFNSNFAVPPERSTGSNDQQQFLKLPQMGRKDSIPDQTSTSWLLDNALTPWKDEVQNYDKIVVQDIDTLQSSEIIVSN